jgi:hypothetical protein
VIRRTAQGKSPFSPDRKHLHHRLQNMGHSHRQSVLLMYLWAALFSGAVVGLSVIRIQVVWLAAVTLAALIALVLATIPQWRPWRGQAAKHVATTGPQAPSPAVTPSEVAVAGAPIPNAPAVPVLPVDEPPAGYQPADYAPGDPVRNGYMPGGYGLAGAYPGEPHHAPAGDAEITEAASLGHRRIPDRDGTGHGWSFRDLAARPKSSRR